MIAAERVAELARQADRDPGSLTDTELTSVLAHGRAAGVRYCHWSAAWDERERRQGTR